ncbi:helix-turn-helix domain-containing protein [Psychroflexus planctonicus]|uniref:Transcriptional regulator n=1 Tax=Psychroflexus planctonicus TaxID=1526575 RepID=A0ABQ1SIJ2_9FLAO|nr:helix-turn-helix transcriptional regulator [Psychroflexus planctonicus]GGE37943.1 transcriptional regulator [Psychroflexus planctonicus]
MSIKINLNEVLQAREMKSYELAEKINITTANLSILKTGKAKAIRLTTLAKICEVLECQPGDILVFEKNENKNSR